MAKTLVTMASSNLWTLRGFTGYPLGPVGASKQCNPIEPIRGRILLHRIWTARQPRARKMGITDAASRPKDVQTSSFALVALQFHGFLNALSYFSQCDAKHLKPDRGNDSPPRTKKAKTTHVSFPMHFDVVARDKCVLHMYGDNSALVDQLNFRVKQNDMASRVIHTHVTIVKLWKAGRISFVKPFSSWYSHIPRALNDKADALVNLAQNKKNSFVQVLQPMVLFPSPPVALQGFWDGGVRSGLLTVNANGRQQGAKSACGWLLQIAIDVAPDGHPKWTNAILGSVVLDGWQVSFAFEAELWGAEFLAASVEYFFNQPFSFNTCVSQSFVDNFSCGGESNLSFSWCYGNLWLGIGIPHIHAPKSKSKLYSRQVCICLILRSQRVVKVLWSLSWVVKLQRPWRCTTRFGNKMMFVGGRWVCSVIGWTLVTFFAKTQYNFQYCSFFTWLSFQLFGLSLLWRLGPGTTPAAETGGPLLVSSNFTLAFRFSCDCFFICLLFFCAVDTCFPSVLFLPRV